jgi:hypothetical protein
MRKLYKDFLEIKYFIKFYLNYIYKGKNLIYIF